MNRLIKEIISVILALCLLLTFFPSEVVTATVESFVSNSGEAKVNMFFEDDYDNKANSFNYIQYLGTHYSSSSISSQIYSSMEMSKLSSTLVDSMLENPLFVEGYSAWIASDLVSNPVGIVEYLSRKTYYETIILKILQSNMEVDTVIDWMNQKYIKNSMKLNKSLTDFANQSHFEYIINNYNLSELTNAERKELESIVKNNISIQNYNIIGESVEFVSDILKISKNVEDFVEKTASYLLLADISDSTIDFLIDIRSHSSDKDLTEAIDDVIAICEDTYKALLVKVVEEKLFAIGKDALKNVLGKTWKSLLISKLTAGVLSNGTVIVNGILIGNVIGRTIDNIAFSTKAKMDKFELMRSLSVFEHVLEDTLKENIVSYDNTEASAQSLCSGVNLLYETYKYDADLFIEMIKISEKDWIAPLYGDQFEEAIANANTVKSYYQGIYDKISISAGLCGNSVGWIVLDDGSLLIYGTGNMNDYTAEKTPWYGEREKIKEIYVSSGVTRIGNYAFNKLIYVNNMIVLASPVECGSNCFDLLGKKAQIVSLNNMVLSGTHNISNEIGVAGNLYCCTTQETHINIRNGITVNVDGNAEFVTSPVYISVINSSIDINEGAILNVNGDLKVSGSSHPSSNWSFHWLSFYINGEVTVGGNFSTGIKTYLYEQNSSGHITVHGNFAQADSLGEISAGTMELGGDYQGKFTASGSHTIILNGTSGQTITGLKAKNLVISNFSNDGITFSNIPSNKLQFTVLCPSGYSKTNEYAVKTDGSKIVPNDNDEYIIENIKGKTIVTIEGIADINSPEHNWNSGEVTTKPTCTESGIKTLKCTRCGATTTEDVPANGHTLVTDDAIEATCTKAGKTEGSHCSVCGKTIKVQEEIPAVSHSWNDGEITTTPTESAAGVRTYTCKTCGVKKTETIAPLSHTHNWSTDWSKDDAEHWHNCLSGCGEQNDKAAHAWNDGEIAKQPTADTEGEKTFECTVCGKSKTEAIPTTGDAVNDVSISVEVQPGMNAPKTQIITSDDELIKAVLTDEEQELVKNGTDIKIILTVDDATGTVSSADKAMVETAIGGLTNYRLGQYLNVNLLKIIGDSQANITETNAPITVTFEIPEALRSKQSYAVIRVHNGTTILEDNDSDSNTITIKTDKFSIYALAYSEKTGDNIGGNRPNQSIGSDDSAPTPPTGDESDPTHPNRDDIDSSNPPLSDESGSDNGDSTPSESEPNDSGDTPFEGGYGSSGDETTSSSVENPSIDESNTGTNDSSSLGYENNSAPSGSTTNDNGENPTTGIAVSCLPLATAVIVLTLTVKRKKK